jgi:hypothetical protein
MKARVLMRLISDLIRDKTGDAPEELLTGHHAWQ